MLMHRCDNRPCCNPAHLLLGTAKDNIRDCVSKGRLNPSGFAANKLTAQDVLEMRALREAGWTTTALAERYGISTASVSRICLRQRWSDI
jgi:hypothetical protein